jgi:hypothetical protein
MRLKKIIVSGNYSDALMIIYQCQFVFTIYFTNVKKNLQFLFIFKIRYFLHATVEINSSTSSLVELK